MSQEVSKELHAFNRFCGIVGIAASQVEERDPPHPDILASVDAAFVAYELTEAVEREYARKLSDMLKTPPMVRKRYKSIPRELRDQIEASHAGKVIDICFRSDVSLRERAKVLIDVFNYIAELPAGCGKDSLVWEKAPLKQLDHISVKQIRWDGIRWEAGSPASWIDPESALQERLVDKMCNKTYESDDPIELIVYLDRQISPPENTDWENRLTTVAGEHLASSPFRAAWLMNGWSDSVHQLA